MGASSLEQQSSDKHVDQLGHIILGASSLEQQSTSRHVDQLGHIILGSSSLEQQSAGRHVNQLSHIILIPSHTGLIIPLSNWYSIYCKNACDNGVKTYFKHRYHVLQSNNRTFDVALFFV
jgi:extradiol dioxygenase family protein